ncbi:MAG: hypothetical protein O7B23_10765 [Deltaproteobacteria bacterium]|nr:hypothetical protein [Deltaproteobacteria bacterium]
MSFKSRRRKRKLRRVTRREKRAKRRGNKGRAAKFGAQREALEAGKSIKQARVAGRVAKAESRGRKGRAKRIQKRADRRGKIVEKLFGKKSDLSVLGSAEVGEEGQKAIGTLTEKASGFGKDAEAAAGAQLELAAGFASQEAAALDQVSGALEEASVLRTQQLGAAKLQEQRAAGGDTVLLSDAEQSIALQQQGQRASVQAAGTGPLGQAMAANSLAQGGEESLRAATARSKEVSETENLLLGTTGGISDQDLAAQRITQGIQVANLQNALSRQQELTTGAARLNLGAESDLFTLRESELATRDALRKIEFNRPKKGGIIGSLFEAGGAVVGGIAGGGTGAAAGAAAGRGLGDIVQSEGTRRR